MNMVLRGALAVAVALVVVVTGASLVSAQSRPPAQVSDICSDAGDSAFCTEKQKIVDNGNSVNNPSSPIIGPSSIMYKVVQTVTIITGAASLIMIMVGGFRYIVSGGDSTATKAAKDTILYAVIGLVVAIFAQTIISFVLSNL